MVSIYKRQTALLATNVRWLRQALELLDTLDDVVFLTSPQGLSPHRVSGHLRHVIEFYECFLDGLVTYHVDYDSRRRDSRLESSRQVATDRVTSLITRLESEHQLRGDGVIFVRMEDATGSGIPEPFLTSTIGRELQSLSSHTIHHFALIAITLRALGVTVNDKFGVAPSTLRYAAAA